MVDLRLGDCLISIHALRGEGDLDFCHCSRPAYNFNPRPPWGGRLRLRCRDRRRIDHFNPRPPWGGRRERRVLHINRLRFQSTPSVGRATLPIYRGLHRGRISIHALRGEGDYYWLSTAATSEHFNPRPPWGGRHKAEISQARITEFQSTPSVGRATNVACRRCYTRYEFQSTPSVGRATTLSAAIVWQTCNFNPRPPWGGRLMVFS